MRVRDEQSPRDIRQLTCNYKDNNATREAGTGAGLDRLRCGFLLVLHRRRLRLGRLVWRVARRCVFTPATEVVAVLAEHKRDWCHDEGKEAEECARPARVERFVHLRREEWEARAEERAHDSHRGERARGDEEVRVDDVVEEPEEEEDDRDAHGDARGERGPERDGWIRRPAEPEERECVDGGGPHADLKPVFGRHRVWRKLLDRCGVAGVEVHEVGNDTDDATNKDGEVGETGVALVEAVADTVDDGERLEEEIHHAVDELKACQDVLDS